MRNLITKISLASVLAVASSGAFAGDFTQTPDPQSVAQGATANVSFRFAGDGVTQEAQLDLGYNSAVFTTVVPTVVVPGSTCGVFSMPVPFIRIVPPSGAGTPLTGTVTTYCSFAFTAAPAAAVANYDFTQRTLECDGPTCTRTGTFRIAVTAPVGNVGPNIGYAPTSGNAAGTGGPVNFTGVTTVGSTGNGQIVATPSAGTGAGTTTVGTFTLTGADAANFTRTSAATLTFTAGVNTAQNITFTCTSGALARTANLQAMETIQGGATSQRFWVLNCPAGSASNVGPTITYTPAAGAAAGTGGPVNFTGVTTIGSTGAGQIAATPSAGSGAGTTTLNSFNLIGGDLLNFSVTSAATLTFTAGVNTPQNITLTCTSGAAARTANLQATETITGGATSQRFWVLNCPAGAAAGVPPVLNYNPVPGSSTTVAAGAAQTISVGCPTDGSACTGSGTGLTATARLETLTATFAGAPFSPTPTMACAFVNEAGGAAASPLDFVALTADPGDIRCTCPANSTNFPTEPFTVSVLERSPASGGTTVPRTFTIVCGTPPPPPACGTLALTPGTLALTQGAAPANVVAVALTGASAGVTRTVACTTSAAPAGSTFTITTSPSPLTVSTLPAPAVIGNVLAACTNTAETTATVTMTCTNTSNTANCASTPTEFTLSCPGQAAPPPPGTFVPVPALNEQGRILLAALVLLMGLGVVGFRMRG